MNQISTNNTRFIPASLAHSVPIIRQHLQNAGLSVIGEFDLSNEPYFEIAISKRSCLVLLVHTPVLLFEAIALDRSAAVFLPVHVVVTGDQDTCYIHWADPVATSGLRVPAPAKGPAASLYARVTKALSAFPQALEGEVSRPSDEHGQRS